ncbi:hypothetical protein [Kordiimonas sp.]|uniref:hypothetical protein n=1 Tax=Kordiimonas sp. TaxID=1970157 RepID=UPI003A8E4968
MLRLLSFCLVLLFASTTTYATQTDDVELLNATLVARLHLAQKPEDGQMVGAYQVSFRANTEEPISKVHILLNPGLQILKVVGAGNKPLNVREKNTTMTGSSGLMLRTATITLPKPLKKNKGRAEIVIHYKGYLKDLSAYGVEGVPDQLHPDFTMIRAEGFAYPVFAKPDMAAISAAWNRKPFHQVAFLDVPGSNTVVGNLAIAQKTTSGDITKLELKSSRPTGLMALAIGPYSTSAIGPVTLALLPAADIAINQQVKDAVTALEEQLGAPASGIRMTVATLPSSYSTPDSQGAYFTHDSAPINMAELKGALFNMWRMNPEGRAGHWAEGFDRVMDAIIEGQPNVAAFTDTLFATSKTLLSNDPAMGKVALTDYIIEGYDDESGTISALAFIVLYQLMGEEAFTNLIAEMRRELSAGYVDMASAAEFLDATVTDKDARKFIKNWFASGKIGKDMDRSGTLKDLVTRYR